MSDLAQYVALCVLGAFLIAATALLEKPPAAVPVVGLLAIAFAVAGLIRHIRRAWMRRS